MNTPHHDADESVAPAPQPVVAAAPDPDLPRCVVCQTPTTGSYEDRFPVCYDCYARGGLRRVPGDARR